MIIRTINEFARQLQPQTLILVEIRSSTNSWSSDDKTAYLGPKTSLKSVYNKIRKDFDKYSYSFFKVKEDEIFEWEGKKYIIHHFKFAPKALGRSDGWSREDKKYYRDLLNTYGPFQDGEPQFYKDYKSSEHDKYKTNYEKERKEKEYVLHKYDYKDQTSKDYVGGFDLDVIFEETLISYIEKGLVFGYIGHSCRKIWVDHLLAKILLPIMKKEEFATWLTSTSGRHFGDSIYDLVENNDRQGVEDKIKGQANYIHDTAVIYNHPEHKGNTTSTIDLWDKLNALGMMKCKNNPFKINI